MLDPFVLLAPVLVLPVVGLLRFLGCGTLDVVEAADIPLPPRSLTVTPDPVNLCPGESVTFTTSVDCTWTSSDKQKLADGTSTKYTAPSTLGAFSVIITATSKDSTQSGTATVNLLSNSATFVILDPVNRADITTKGNWPPIYGSKGYALAGDPLLPGDDPGNLIKTLPPLPDMTKATALLNVHTFTDKTMDSRGLVKPPANTTRFAAAWSDPSIVQMTLQFNDCNTHRVSMYFVDWDNQGRDQTISLLDDSQVPPATLDSYKLSSFFPGAYLAWDLRGKVVLRITSNAGPFVVISGLFFD
jgi:hypothetical protein